LFTMKSDIFQGFKGCDDYLSSRRPVIYFKYWQEGPIIVYDELLVPGYLRMVLGQSTNLKKRLADYKVRYSLLQTFVAHIPGDLDEAERNLKNIVQTWGRYKFGEKFKMIGSEEFSVEMDGREPSEKTIDFLQAIKTYFLSKQEEEPTPIQTSFIDGIFD
jgi:hypothetical protein